ncbi:MAG: 6,7-dimethyl-8-ribityllumazine synthase [Chloroflexi bacterium]|nr:6,7-dimethyl-8-ribityllumazine synthase [Chloroflexota bacterium]
MPRRFEGHLIGTGKRFAIVQARFNRLVADRLLEGALDALSRHGVRDEDIDVFLVPGSFELPLVAKRAAGKGYAAVVCVGALIRGETPHFEYIAAEASKGIGAVSVETNVPVIFGVITADNMDQALDRAGGKSGNKGYDAAVAAIEMANLLEQLA